MKLRNLLITSAIALTLSAGSIVTPIATLTTITAHAAEIPATIEGLPTREVRYKGNFTYDILDEHGNVLQTRNIIDLGYNHHGMRLDNATDDYQRFETFSRMKNFVPRGSQWLDGYYYVITPSANGRTVDDDYNDGLYMAAWKNLNGGESNTSKPTSNTSKSTDQPSSSSKRVKRNANWNKTSDGWTYTVDDEEVTGWNKIGNTWYHFDDNGIMQTGWIRVNDQWYYMNESGAMQAGWINSNGNWYYMNPSGDMTTGWVNSNGNWYYINPSGAMAKGWINDRGTWYYTNESGVMLSNTVIDNYKLGPSGAWVR